MNKTEVIETIKKVAKEFGFVVPKKMELKDGKKELYTIGDLTQDDIDDLLKIFAKSYEVLGEELEVGESVNVGATVLTKKKTKARSGVSKLGEQEINWSVPEKIKLVISTKKSFEKEHEQEI